MHQLSQGEEKIDEGKRSLMFGGAAFLTMTTLGVQNAAAKTLDRANGIPQSFIHAIDRYEGSDSPQEGNMEKYRSLVAPMIVEGLDKNNNLAKLRYLIYREVKHGYRLGASSDFREYDAEQVWNDKAFFGDIGDLADKEYLYAVPNIVSDNRLEGAIGMQSPENILATIPNRIPEYEGEDIAFIIRDSRGVNIFVYYEAGKLKYMLPTSPGIASLGSTPDNLRVTDRKNLANYFLDDSYQRTGRTRKDGTKGGPMAYSLRLDHFTGTTWKYDGHNTHVGHVTGKPASHGCARQSILGAYLMFYDLNPGTLVYYRPEVHLAS